MKNNFQNLEGVYTVDPGMNTAMVYWVDGMNYPPVIKTFGCTSKAKTRVEKISDLSMKFSKQLDTHVIPLEKIYIEGVEFWEHNLTSRTATVRGDTILLSYIVGAYIEVCRSKSVPCEILEARMWKGQMDKSAVKARVDRVFTTNFGTSHAYDAVGIGLSLMGLL
jgi:hypothetical protein